MRTTVRSLVALVCLLSISLIIPAQAIAGGSGSAGVWQTQSLDPSGDDEVFAVGASSLDDEWAVGRENQNQGWTTVLWADHWDGSAWTVFDVPQVPGSTNAWLEAVAVLSPTDAWAAGSSSTNNDPTALLRHWDGTAWSVADQPPNEVWSENGGMVFTDPGNGWLVGAEAAQAGPDTTGYIDHWDGLSWSKDTLPDGICGGDPSFLYDITATSATDAWAVGSCGTDTYSPLALHWDGVSWTQVSVPMDPNSNFSFLSGISAVSSDDIWADGTGVVPGDYGSLMVHWDGRSWSMVSTPSLPSESYLNDIAAVSSDDVWATGKNDDDSLLTEHWDGTSWTVFDGVGPGGQFRNLVGSPDGLLWASTKKAVVRLVEAEVADTGLPSRAIKGALGATVTWHFSSTNSKAHSVTDASLGQFDTGPVAAGGSFVYRFVAAGTYSVSDRTTHSKEKVAIAPKAKFKNGTIAVTWSASKKPPTGLVYDVQVKVPGGSWATWQDGTTAASSTYAPSGGGTYTFRARLRDSGNGNSAGWSPSVMVKVKVL